MVNNMTMKEKNRFGIYLVAINLILILFMLTSSETNLIYAITAIVSATIAIIFNIILLKQSQKKTLNIIALILNAIILIGLIIYTITKYNLITL